MICERSREIGESEEVLRTRENRKKKLVFDFVFVCVFVSWRKREKMEVLI